MNLRTLRWALLAYAAFDLFFGGVCGGFLPLTPLAAAQFTTVSGTVTDPNGLPYANGTIAATLISSASPTLGGFPYTPPTQPTGLSTAGSFVMQLADNTQLTPGGTTWNFLVCSALGTVQPATGKGPICFAVTGVTISGASQSITSTLTAAAPPLSSSFVTPSGPVTANAVVLGAGGNGTKVSTGITSNGASELDVGVAGGAAGVIGWNGSTSGKCTNAVDATSTTLTSSCALVPSANGTGFGNGSFRWNGLFTAINMSGGFTGFQVAAGSTMSTATNCAAVGTAANPSVASCTSAIAGSFSCATNASTGTCQVNTTAVTANSEIFVTQRSDATTGTRLSVTCNATLSTVLPEITAVTAGSSFTINLGTITTNPECFSFFLVN